MKIKKIYLDVGDTLLFLNTPPGGIYLDILQSHGLIDLNLDSALLKNAFSDAWIHMNQNTDREFRDRYRIHPDGKDGWWKELIHTFLKKVSGENSPYPKEIVFQKIFERFDNEKLWNIEPSFFEMEKIARDRGISLGIISNWDLRLRGLLERKSLTQYFDPILISAEFGFEKPSERIFKEAQNLARCEGEELVYIGDKVDLDYYTPHRMGWKAFILRKEKNHEFPTIESLVDVFQSI